MLIECRAKRAGGTEVDFGDEVYNFVPKDDKDPDSPHVCEVDNPLHVERFLSISECYNELGKEPRPKAAPVVSKDIEPVTEMVDDNEEAEDDPELEMVETLIQLSVREIRGELPGLSDKQLQHLFDLEEGLENRATLLADIRTEGKRREEQAPSEGDDVAATG